MKYLSLAAVLLATPAHAAYQSFQAIGQDPPLATGLYGEIDVSHSLLKNSHLYYYERYSPRTDDFIEKFVRIPSLRLTIEAVITPTHLLFEDGDFLSLTAPQYSFALTTTPTGLLAHTIIDGVVKEAPYPGRVIPLSPVPIPPSWLLFLTGALIYEQVRKRYHPTT